jgi:hypothetical protein
MGEWCSPKEQVHWVRASLNKTSGSNTIIHFPTVMIYSISVLEEADFVSLGREMPKGTGINNSVEDGTMSKASKRKLNNKKQRQRKKKNNADESNITLLQALDGGTKSESKLSALCLMLEFGSTEEKLQAMREVKRVALMSSKTTNEYAVDDSKKDDKDESIGQQDDNSSDESDGF